MLSSKIFYNLTHIECQLSVTALLMKCPHPLITYYSEWEIGLMFYSAGIIKCDK